MRRIHICCGDVYLDGYENVDIAGDVIELTRENTLKTTIENYYNKPFGEPVRRAIIDYHLDLIGQEWPYEINSIDEFLMICALEHFLPHEIETIIGRLRYSLRPGGKLNIEVPDVVATVEQFANNPHLMFKLIYATSRDIYSCHRWGYTQETLNKVMGDSWASVEAKTIIKHSYPVLGVECVK